MHIEKFRVRFGPMHARNFAEQALRAGFLDSEICAAYRAGLDETHASATRDRADSWDAPQQREPSQAIARGWLRLRSDERTDEQRWAALFSGAAVPVRVFEAPAASPRSLRAENGAAGSARPAAPASTWRQVAPGLRVRSEPDAWEKKKAAAEKLPDTTPALANAHRKENATFEKYLTARGLTLADVLKFTRADQQKFVREMHAWQRGGDSQKPA